MPKKTPSKKIDETKSIQLDLKFQHISPFDDVKAVYQVIQSHDGRGRKKNTASTFIAECFRTWAPEFTPSMVDTHINHMAIRRILEEKNISSLEDFYVALSDAKPKEIEILPDCGRRGVRFYLNRETEKQLYDLLKKWTEKQRAFRIYIMVKNYIARENYDLYYELVCPPLFQGIVNYYYKTLGDLEERETFDRFVEYTVIPHIRSIKGEQELQLKDKSERDIIRAREIKDLFGF